MQMSTKVIINTCCVYMKQLYAEILHRFICHTAYMGVQHSPNLLYTLVNTNISAFLVGRNSSDLSYAWLSLVLMMSTFLSSIFNVSPCYI